MSKSDPELTIEWLYELARTTPLSPEQRRQICSQIDGIFERAGVKAAPFELPPYQPQAITWWGRQCRRWQEGFLLIFMMGLTLLAPLVVGIICGYALSLIWKIFFPYENVMEDFSGILAVALAPYYVGLFFEGSGMMQRNPNGSLIVRPSRGDLG